MHQEYELFVFTSDRDINERSALPEIIPDSWQNYQDIAKVYYASGAALKYKHIYKIIQSVQPDFIYLNSFFSKYFTLFPILLSRFNKHMSKIVLAPRGMLKPSALRFKAAKKKIFLRVLKMTGLYKNIIFHATDEKEAIDVRIHFPLNKIAQVPNFPGAITGNRTVLHKKAGQLSIIFIGRIHPIKNLDFLLRACNGIDGNIHLSIVGVMEQEQFWNYCQEIVKELPDTVLVNFIGEIPYKKLGTFINEHHILALPTKGENFGHAIFDALSYGKPVLISDQTPWRKLQENKAGWDIPLHQPQLFTKALQEAVSWDVQTYAEWSEGAYKVATDFVKQSDLLEQYKKIFS